MAQTENTHQLHQNYIFTQLDSAHSWISSISLQRTLRVPAFHCRALFRNGADMRQKAVQHWLEVEAVSQQ